MNIKSKKIAATRRPLLAGASMIAAAAAMAGAPAFAQDAEEDEDTIVVTGSRLVRQDFEAISPVTTVTSEQLELTATISTEALLNELPQIIPGNTVTSNNVGGQSFSTLDLRGLGPGRTLILVNGERVPASSTNGVVDINTIPASMISRIEVVTGGASAVYGSDAMAGVINFVLKDDYEGAEVNVTYGSELSTGNAETFEINGLVGGNFADGRGNMTIYGSYSDRDKVGQSEYDYSRVAGAICYDLSRGVSNAYYICDSTQEAIDAPFANPNLFGGSPTPPWGWIPNSAANPFGAAALNANPATLGQFASYDHDCNPATPNIAYGAGPLTGRFDLSFNDNGDLEPRNTRGACVVPERANGSSYYNFAPTNYLIIPAERVALTTSGHYDISDTVRLNLLVNYTNSRSEVQLAPTPATNLTVTLTPAMRALIQTGIDGIDGNSDDHDDLWAALQSRPSPYAPFTINRRTNELGTRNAFSENNNFYVITSLDGSLGENWDWNLSASYGQSNFQTRTINSANKNNFTQGLSGCQTLLAGPDGLLNTADDTGGPITGGSGTSQFPCVPLDIFGAGSLTPAMVGYLSTQTFNNSLVEENRVAGFVRGNLFELPAGPVASVVGFEYRDTYMEARVDNEQRLGNIYGFNALQDQFGGIDVYELYTEFAVPLVSEQPFAYYLGLEAGFRRSEYSTIGGVDSYKYGGEWAPVEWLRFRAMFNQATRAPNVFELFRAGDQGFSATVDPCIDTAENGGLGNGLPDGIGGTTPYAPTVAQCVATGVPAGVYPGFTQNAAQLQVFGFGNANLTAETAETLTYGFVFQPDWFPIGDLRATVDWYDIDIADAISGLGAGFFLRDCFTNNTPASCARINRIAGTGQVNFINTSVTNLNNLTTTGTDIQLEWSLQLGPGQLTINELYTILETIAVNGSEFQGTTTAGIGGHFPDYKSALSISYNVGDWTVFGRWSYVPEVVSGNAFGPCNCGPGSAQANVSPAASYVDASLRWNISDAFTVTGVINNVFDEYPPQTADGFVGQGNTDPVMYRPLGRSFAVSGRYRF